MGDAVKLRHARASMVSAAASASKVISFPLPFSKANLTREGQRRDGMPRLRQELTVLSLTPRASETAVVPPRTSIADAGVNDMDPTIVRNLRTSQGLANCEATSSHGADEIALMAAILTGQAKRLAATRLACGVETQDEFATALGMSKGHWNDFENGKRPLTLGIARRIKRRYKLPLDWTLDGDFQALEMAPAQISRRLETFVA